MEPILILPPHRTDTMVDTGIATSGRVFSCRNVRKNLETNRFESLNK